MPTRRKPKLSRHKHTGQFYVRLKGKVRYLGADERLAQERYDELISDWLRGQSDFHLLTCDELALLYIEHAQDHYVKNGRNTRVHAVRLAMRYFVASAERCVSDTSARAVSKQSVGRW